MCKTCFERGYSDYPNWVGSAEHPDDYRKGFDTHKAEVGEAGHYAEEVDFCETCYNRGYEDGLKKYWSPPTTPVYGHKESYSKGFNKVKEERISEEREQERQEREYMSQRQQKEHSVTDSADEFMKKMAGYLFVLVLALFAIFYAVQILFILLPILLLVVYFIEVRKISFLHGSVWTLVATSLCSLYFIYSHHNHGFTERFFIETVSIPTIEKGLFYIFVGTFGVSTFLATRQLLEEYYPYNESAGGFWRKDTRQYMIGAVCAVIMGIPIYIHLGNNLGQNNNLSLLSSNKNSSNISGKYPQASERILLKDEIKEMNAEDLSIMRNEIFARKGLIFGKEDIKNYFSAQSWYKPIDANFESIASKLSMTEKTNIDLIKSIENEKAILILICGEYKNIEGPCTHYFNHKITFEGNILFFTYNDKDGVLISTKFIRSKTDNIQFEHISNPQCQISIINQDEFMFHTYNWGKEGCHFIKKNKINTEANIQTSNEEDQDEKFKLGIISGEFKSTSGNCTPYCIITISENNLRLDGINYSGSNSITYTENYTRSKSDKWLFQYPSYPKFQIKLFSKNEFTFTSPTKNCKFIKTNRK